MSELRITQADVDRINAEFLAMVKQKADREEADRVAILEQALAGTRLDKYGIEVTGE